MKSPGQQNYLYRVDFSEAATTNTEISRIADAKTGVKQWQGNAS